MIVASRSHDRGRTTGTGPADAYRIVPLRWKPLHCRYIHRLRQLGFAGLALITCSLDGGVEFIESEIGSRLVTVKTFTQLSLLHDC
jgi:hypothetical protein